MYHHRFEGGISKRRLRKVLSGAIFYALSPPFLKFHLGSTAIRNKLCLPGLILLNYLLLSINTKKKKIQRSEVLNYTFF